MKSAVALVLLALAPGCWASGAHDPHPITKVIKMLQGLSAKAEMEGKREAVAYQEYEYWCRTSTTTLDKAIAAENEKISSLSSQVEAKEKQEKALQMEISQLEVQIGDLQRAGEESLRDRESANGLYTQASEDLTSTIAAIGSAITALMDSKPAQFMQLLAQPKIRGALALAEESATDEGKRGAIAALLQQRPELEAEGDYESHIKQYRFKSGNVIELLKALKADFEAQKLAAVKAETNSVNAYNLAHEGRETAIQATKDSKGEKSSLRSGVLEDLEQHKLDLKAEREDLAADTATLAETKKACMVKKQEWEERSAVRSQEIEAMAAAVKILAKATGVRTEEPTNPVPPPTPVSLLQLARMTRRPQAAASFAQIAADPRARVVNLLRSTAHTTHSQALERLAQEISVMKDGPFNQVINLVEKMIFRLMDEQKDEDEHKKWCDLELSKSSASKEDKDDKIAELSSKIEADEATVRQLTQDIEEAQDMVAKITTFMKDATEIREVGKKENAEALKDAQDAQSAIADATAVLETFYKESGMIEKAPYEFVQRGVELPESPSTWDAAYTGVAEPKAQPMGIIAVLEEIAGDFSKMEADTRSQEETDQNNYEAEIKDHKIEKERRETESEVKGQEKKRLLDKIASTKESRKHTAGELEAVEQYLKDLEPACVDGDSTYEDRKAARTKETEALRQAQSILTDAFKTPEPAFLAMKPAKFLDVRRHA